jgi:aryl-alcohol dehydrogenase-like predicted oxidoreductase
VISPFRATSLADYRLLGRSGLRVSPLALGAMTFGDDWGWGADEAESKRIFDAYVDRGGNFVDTANQYTNGSSERLVGEFSKAHRDSLVIATKYSLSMHPGDPNAGGNHRKSMVRSVEDSLERLQTDYVDLLYLHLWDFTTPVEEILRAMDDLVRAGKVLYIGLSNIPAWQASRMQTIADLRGWTPISALQIEFSLIERTVERDLIPMAREMGMGVIPWAPLGSGVLTGKYSAADLPDVRGGSPSTEGTRRNIALVTGALSERGLRIAQEVKQVAAELGSSAAQVAIAWTLANPSVTAPIIGARTVAQLEDNLLALDVVLDESHFMRLDAVSRIDLGSPHEMLTRPMAHELVFPGLKPVGRRR